MPSPSAPAVLRSKQLVVASSHPSLIAVGERCAWIWSPLGEVVGVDLADGRTVARHVVGFSNAAPPGALALDDRLLVFQDTTVAVIASEPKRSWRYESGWHPKVVVCPADRLLVAHQEELVVLDLETGATVKRVPPLGGGSTRALTLAGHLAIVLTSTAVFALDATSFALVWQADISALEGDGNAELFACDEDLWATKKGQSDSGPVLRLYAIGLSDGRVRQPLQVEGRVTPRIAAGSFLVAVAPARMIAIDGTGIVLDAPAAEAFEAVRLGAGDAVLVSDGARLALLRRDQGKVVLAEGALPPLAWSARASADGKAIVFCDPKGLIVIRSDDLPTATGFDFERAAVLGSGIAPRVRVTAVGAKTKATSDAVKLIELRGAAASDLKVGDELELEDFFPTERDRPKTVAWSSKWRKWSAPVLDDGEATQRFPFVPVKAANVDIAPTKTLLVPSLDEWQRRHAIEAPDLLRRMTATADERPSLAEALRSLKLELTFAPRTEKGLENAAVFAVDSALYPTSALALDRDARGESFVRRYWRDDDEERGWITDNEGPHRDLRDYLASHVSVRAAGKEASAKMVREALDLPLAGLDYSLVPARPLVKETKTNTTRQRFECVEDGSSKFWEVALREEGATRHVVETHFGRIGTKGQTKTKEFATGPLAKKEHDKLIAEKLKKGYKAASPTPSKTMAAIEDALASLGTSVVVERGRPATVDAIASTAASLGIRIPDDYEEFLLSYGDLVLRGPDSAEKIFGIDDLGRGQRALKENWESWDADTTRLGQAAFIKAYGRIDADNAAIRWPAEPSDFHTGTAIASDGTIMSYERAHVFEPSHGSFLAFALATIAGFR